MHRWINYRSTNGESGWGNEILERLLTRAGTVPMSLNDDEYVWPHSGMSLFLNSDLDDPLSNAWMPSDPDWITYKSGYEDAVQLLVQHSSSGMGPDFLIYPILFTARQAIELGLKEIIIGNQRTAGDRESPHGHDLDQLWTEAQGHLLNAGGTSDEAMVAFGELLAQLHDVDPRSTTFRYPVNREGKAPFAVADDDGGEGLPRLINTADLGVALTAMFHYLSGTRDWLEDAVETQRMAEQDASAGDDW